MEQEAPKKSSNSLIWWLTAACVTKRSSAALVKFKWRAADSNAFNALSGGSFCS